MKAVVLLSGGIDSTVVAWMAKEEGRDLYALSFDYGQAHVDELRCAAVQAVAVGVTDHRTVAIDLRGISLSALLGSSPIKDRPIRDAIADTHPSTYVPARNTIFLGYALGYAETIGAEEIWIGANQDDAAGYPDCRPSYLQAFQTICDLVSPPGCRIVIRAPLRHMSKAHVCYAAKRDRIDLTQTRSCYRPGSVPCESCDACRLRAHAFSEAAKMIADSNNYRDPWDAL